MDLYQWLYEITDANIANGSFFTVLPREAADSDNGWTVSLGDIAFKVEAGTRLRLAINERREPYVMCEDPV